MRRNTTSGFALPTVLIASVVMLGILTSAIAVVSATRNALRAQNYAQLAKTAGESGLAMAKACIAAGTTTWANPLRPGGTCAGLSFPCSAANCYVVNDTVNNVQTSFSVTAPTVAGDVSTVRVTGFVDQVRASTGEIVRTYQQELRQTQVSTGLRDLRWKEVTTGSDHTCALASDNKAYCWGRNNSSQLGDNSTTDRLTPVAVAQGALPAGATIRQLVAGYYHTCALASDNKAYCWGSNGNGQLGDNSTTRRLTPVAVAQGALPAGATINQLVAGYSYTCALASDNKAYCWGANGNGQLGDNSTTQRLTPVAVAQGALPAGATIRQLASGYSHTCALASDNKAYCWGYNANGQLGDNSTTRRLTPVAVAQGTMPTGATIRQLASGYYHTCALASDNKAYCWGYNNNGQLGDNSTTNRLTPVAVAQGALPAGATISQLASGYYHTCALASDNKAYCWGYNTYGQNGDNTTIGHSMPAAVSFINDPTTAPLPDGQLVAGYYHTCALASDNKAYCWGRNNNGQLGDNSTTQRNTPVAVSQGALPTGATISQLAGGYYHTCALASDSKAYCWGNNTFGQLGDNSTTQRNSPVAVAQGALPTGATIRQLVAGYFHICALASDNKAYCWGSNGNGELGDNSTTQRLTPVAVAQGALPAGATIRQLVAGYFYTCALASDNKAYCWGQNSFGQLGDNSTTQRLTPVAVAQGALPAGATIRQLVAGNSHTCALASDNKAYCWGRNNNGQLGDNSTTDRLTPVPVAQGALPTGATIRQLVAGNAHTCALASDNKAYCWGANGSGNLGDNSTTTRLAPVATASLPAFVISAKMLYFY